MVSRGRTTGTVGRSADLPSHKDDEEQEWQSQAQDRSQHAPNFSEIDHGNQVENYAIQQHYEENSHKARKSL